MRRRVSPAAYCPTGFRMPLAARRAAAVALVALLALAGTVVDSDAARFRRGEHVRVSPGEIVDDDLYAAGGSIRIEGTVTGDLIAVGGEVVVTGAVNGSVLACGAHVSIEGPVGGTLRTAGGHVTVSGTVARDVMAAGDEIRLDRAASVRRDVVAAGNRISVADSVGRNAVMVGDHLRLEDGAEVGSNLDYGSKNALYVGSGASVRGSMRNHSGAWKMRSTNPQKHAILAVYHWMRWIVGTFVLGVLLVVPFGAFTRRTLDTLGSSVFGSLMAGLLMMLLFPVFALFLLLFGLIAGGWWLGLFAFVFWLLAILLGYVIGSLVVGRWVVARLGGSGVGLVWTLLFGVIGMSLIRLVPILGFLVACIAMVMGLGALTITSARRPKSHEHLMAPRPEALAGP